MSPWCTGTGAPEPASVRCPLGTPIPTEIWELLPQRSTWQKISEPIGLEILLLISVQMYRSLKTGDRCVCKACFVKRLFSSFDFSYLHWSYISELKRELQPQKILRRTQARGAKPSFCLPSSPFAVLWTEPREHWATYLALLFVNFFLETGSCWVVQMALNLPYPYLSLVSNWDCRYMTTTLWWQRASLLPCPLDPLTTGYWILISRPQD